MVESERKITIEEYELSIIKHYAHQDLNEYISIMREKHGYCEFAGFWLNEFFTLEDKYEIENFMKIFRMKLQKYREKQERKQLKNK